MTSFEDERAIESTERRMERENELDGQKHYFCDWCGDEIDIENEDWTVMGLSIYCGKCVDNGWNNRKN